MFFGSNGDTTMKKLSIFSDTRISGFASMRIMVLWGAFLCLATAVYYSANLSSDNYVVQPRVVAAANPTISRGQTFAAFIKKTVNNLHYSSYKLGGNHVDSSRGVYIVDCSLYVDYLLKTAFPRAYTSLVNSTGVARPNSKNYYDFFMSLSNAPRNYWNKIRNANQLQPGDILVFCNKNLRPNHAAGHVMVVMKKPVGNSNEILVSVSDSAPVGHGQDTRPSHTSGIGIGTMLLKLDPNTGQPAAYAWKQGSPWKNNVKFAMARPVDIT